VYGRADHTPDHKPYVFKLLNDSRYTAVTERAVAKAGMFAVAENALDVPHTAFLHRGLFRNNDQEKRPLDVVVRRTRDRVEAEYIGETRPKGIAGRLLAPTGGAVHHVDRFIMPSIVEVEYRLGTASHFLVASALTPVTEQLTELWAVVAFCLPLPGRVVKTALRPIAKMIFQQDARMLKQQANNIQRFGGEQFLSSPIDVMAPHMLRLLRDAERGVVPADKLNEKQLQIWV